MGEKGVGGRGGGQGGGCGERKDNDSVKCPVCLAVQSCSSILHFSLAVQSCSSVEHSSQRQPLFCSTVPWLFVLFFITVCRQCQSLGLGGFFVYLFFNASSFRRFDDAV